MDLAFFDYLGCVRSYELIHLHFFMKNITLLLLLNLFTFNSHAQLNTIDLKDRITPVTPKTAFISYSVPINISLAQDDVYGLITGIKENYTPEELDYLSFIRLAQDKRREFVEIVLEKVRSREVTAYEVSHRVVYDPTKPNLYYPDPISGKKIASCLGRSISYPKLDLETDEPMYDDNGEQIYEDTIIPYEADDILSINFRENWSVNATTNILEKQIVGYSFEAAYFNPETDDLMGTRELFYIPCADKKIKTKNLLTLAENMESQTKVKQLITYSKSDYERANLGLNYKGGGNLFSLFIDPSQYKWENESLSGLYHCNLSSDFRYAFFGANKFTPFLSANKELPVYKVPLKGFSQGEDKFPYSEILTKEELKLSGGQVSEVARLDPETDNFAYDNNGDQIYDEIFWTYGVRDIIRLGFVEDWSFDKENLTIQKKVKGIIPVIVEHSDETGDVIGTKKLFCIRYED